MGLLTDHCLPRETFNNVFSSLLLHFLFQPYDQGLERLYSPTSREELFQSDNYDHVKSWVNAYYQRGSKKKRRDKDEDYSESADLAQALNIVGQAGVGKYQLLKCLCQENGYDIFERSLSSRLSQKEISHIEEATKCRNLGEQTSRKLIIFQNYDQLLRMDRRLHDTLDSLIADSKHPFIFTSEEVIDSGRLSQYAFVP